MMPVAAQTMVSSPPFPTVCQQPACSAAAIRLAVSLALSMRATLTSASSTARQLQRTDLPVPAASPHSSTGAQARSPIMSVPPSTSRELRRSAIPILTTTLSMLMPSWAGTIMAQQTSKPTSALRLPSSTVPERNATMPNWPVISRVRRPRLPTCRSLPPIRDLAGATSGRWPTGAILSWRAWRCRLTVMTLRGGRTL